MIKNKNTKVAFAALRMQPLHKGHYRLISQMLMENDLVLVGLGSVQVEGTSMNPYSAKERTDFVKTIFASSKIKIIPLSDQGAVRKEDWVSYCMNKIKGANQPTPTDYYAGSETDLEWFKGAKNLNGEELRLINMERYETNIMSGTDIRKSISAGAEEWKKHVPYPLISAIESCYPEKLKLENFR